MVSINKSIERVIVEHVTIRSGNTFAATRTALESLIPRLDDGFLTLLRFGLIDRRDRSLNRRLFFRSLRAATTARFSQ
jgi:hypothetical protein